MTTFSSNSSDTFFDDLQIASNIYNEFQKVNIVVWRTFQADHHSSHKKKPLKIMWVTATVLQLCSIRKQAIFVYVAMQNTSTPPYYFNIIDNKLKQT